MSEDKTPKKKLRRSKPEKKDKKALPEGDIGELGRTVVVTGLPEKVTQGQIYKKFRKVGTVEETKFPVGNGEAHVRFATHKEARLAVTKLDKHIFKASKMTVVVKSKVGKGPSQKSLKKARLIVRNLSFKCSEDELKVVCSKFGEVVAVNIPLKPDTDKRLGPAFVQFANVFQAAKAQSELNGKEIKGRPVAIDFVMQREKFLEKTKKPEEEAEEAMDVDGEGKSQSEDEGSEDEESMSGDDGDGGSDGDDDDEDEDDEDDDSDDDDKPKRRKKDNRPKAKWEDDANEGKTLFVRNVSFDTEGDGLKEAFTRFGEVRYARILMDFESEQSRGMAFVMFKEKEGAETCMKAMENQESLSVDGRELNVALAVTRSNTSQFEVKTASEERKENTDKRNLYLAKEGVIFATSDAAKELSQIDLAKRRKAELEKKAKLANPNCFVSTTRLCVRNIPRSVSDEELRTVFTNCRGKGKKQMAVKKARIMRDLATVNASGVARPRGFGFVEFAVHDEALEALRVTNNNPEIFGKDKRLIVEFSIEDRRALHKQEMRRQKFTGERGPGARRGKPFQKERQFTAGQGARTGGAPTDGGDSTDQKKARQRKPRNNKKSKSKDEQAGGAGAGVGSARRPAHEPRARPGKTAGAPQGKPVKPPKTSRRNKPDVEEVALEARIKKHRALLSRGDAGQQQRSKWFD